MVRALELSPADQRRIAAACERAGVEFLSTPFDARASTSSWSSGSGG
jgi:sialic acid synthase SpsE